jgi:3-oxoadipate enol-lactonase
MLRPMIPQPLGAAIPRAFPEEAAPMPWIDTNDASLHYQLEGEGPPLVLVHEMGGCLESWSHVVPLLRGRRVLRFDQRGAGLSQKIVGRLEIGTLVADLAGLLDALGMAGPVGIAGCAVGAAVSLAFAARHPARVAGVVAMAPATHIPPDRRQAMLDLADEIERAGMRARTLDRLDQTFPARFRTGDGRLEAFRAIALANDPRSYAAVQRMLAGLELGDDLKRIACPTLVLAGETDTTRPPAMVAEAIAPIRGAVFRTVPSGHVMPMLTPELVAAEIDAFLPVGRRAG